MMTCSDILDDLKDAQEQGDWGLIEDLIDALESEQSRMDEVRGSINIERNGTG